MLKEIKPDASSLPGLVVSRRRADPVAPEVFDRTVDEVCAGVRKDTAEMRQRRLRAYAMGEIILD